MRRMLTNKNVVDVVNKAIDDGEIEVGGLPEIESGDAGKALVVNSGETGVEWAEVSGLPEIESGDAGKLLAVNSGETGTEWVEDNNLKLPDTAPASNELVIIDQDGEQNSLTVGDGLEIANGELATSNMIQFEMTGISENNSKNQTLNVSSNVYNKLLAGSYKTVSVKLTKSNNYSFSTLLNYEGNGETINWQGIGFLTSNTSINVPGLNLTNKKYTVTIYPGGGENNIQLSYIPSSTSDYNGIFKQSSYSENPWGAVVSSSTGTLNSNLYTHLEKFALPIRYNDGSNYHTLYYIGKDGTNAYWQSISNNIFTNYLMTVTISSKAYAITQVS